MATWRLLLLTTALAFVPAGAFAQADGSGEGVAQVATDASGASLDCRGLGLKIMAAEVSGARFVCQVSGAPAGDSSFSVQAVSTADQTHTLVPLCSGSLADGAGACSGAFIDRLASGLAQISLAVTLRQCRQRLCFDSWSSRIWRSGQVPFQELPPDIERD